jgi:hypothetical protein
MATIPTPVMTINPIDGGTNVITAANDASGVLWSGIDPEPNEQNTTLTLGADYEHSPLAAFSTTFLNANGLWSVTTRDLTTATGGSTMPDGVYEARVSNFVDQGSPDETVILAAHATPLRLSGWPSSTPVNNWPRHRKSLSFTPT